MKNYLYPGAYIIKGVGKMKVKDIMHNILRLPPNLSVAEIASIMNEKSTGSVLLEDKGKVVGIITERDILRKIVAKKKDPNFVRGIEIANYPLITIEADGTLEEAARRMAENNIRRILVSDNGRIIGKVTAGAITKNVRYIAAERITGERRY